MRFLGNIEAKTDAKGRAFLPSVFRKVLQASGEENLVLRRDVFQPCLTTCLKRLASFTDLAKLGNLKGATHYMRAAPFLCHCICTC